MSFLSISQFFSSQLFWAHLLQVFRALRLGWSQPQSGSTPRALANGHTHHCLRPDCSRIFGLEAPTRTGMAKASAIRAWSGNRRPDWRLDLGVGKPCARESWVRHISYSLQPLRALPTKHALGSVLVLRTCAVSDNYWCSR